MGIYANYQFLSDENLNKVIEFDKKDEEFFEWVEEINEDAEILLDIDKMWDVLHFVLTGVESGKPIENNPLSEAVVGVTPLEEVSEFVAYTEKGRVREILSALENFDFEKAMENFSMEECKKAKLYPDIWDDEDEADEIKEELIEHFENMKEFYRKILKLDGSVLVTIY